MTNFVTRFAPSPTGLLHLGHAASAFTVWQAAQRAGGTMLLRIEDIDTTRCRPEYHDAIIEDLHWLGLDWPTPVRVQSDHFQDYQSAVEHLAERGFAYRCFRTRQEINALAAPEKGLVAKPLAPEEIEARLAQGQAFAWRLNLREVRSHLGALWTDLSFELQTDHGLKTIKAEPERHGDIVLARKDSPSAYHLAATFDDALQGITHIIRGEDLIDAPHIQTVLQVLFDWPQPIYQHHRLILGTDGKRLSKRNGSQSLASLRENGMTATDIKRMTGFL